ncbi:MAG: hypothetical protein ACP5GU_07610 [Thermoprotei archaeon]|jgi:hypothetical protein
MDSMDDLKTSIGVHSIRHSRSKVYSLVFILILLLSILIPYMISALLIPWMLFIYWSFLAIIAIILSYLYMRGEVR